MTDALLDLTAVSSDLRLEGHLQECAQPHTDWRDCRWCHWAVSTPQIRLLLDARHDARRLLQSDAGSVPWVTATVDLLRLADDVDVHEILVPSVRRIAHQLGRAVETDLDRLRARLGHAVAPGGPVERRCVQTAGPLAAVALQQPGHAHVLDRLPSNIGARVTHAAASLSTTSQVAGLLPGIEQVHGQDLPVLRTQPEWRRRSGPRTTAGPSSSSARSPQPAAGSLEALVVESVVDRISTELAQIGADLDGMAPPVTVSRPMHSGRYSARTRARLWRIARIDWHLTFVDTGRADCWNAREEGGCATTDLPWQVALAIDVADDHGLVSATHQDRPTVRPGGAVRPGGTGSPSR